MIKILLLVRTNVFSTYQLLALVLGNQNHDHLQQVQKHTDYQDVHACVH